MRCGLPQPIQEKWWAVEQSQILKKVYILGLVWRKHLMRPKNVNATLERIKQPTNSERDHLRNAIQYCDEQYVVTVVKQLSRVA